MDYFRKLRGGGKAKAKAKAPSDRDAEAGSRNVTEEPTRPTSSDEAADEHVVAPLLAEHDSTPEISESSLEPPLCSSVPYWPLPGLLLLVLVILFIYYSQTKKSMALKWYDYYYAKLTVASGLKTKTYSGSSGDTYSYNVWEAIIKLWKDEAYVLSVFVATWSGVWPYVKLLILGVGVCIYHKSPLPRTFDWLSIIAHYSYIDLWMVLISAVSLKFYYEGEESKSEEKDLIEIKVAVTLELWFQSYAEHGAYYFMAAIAMSQLFGYVIIKCAQAPFAARGPTDILGETACFGFDTAFSQCKRWDLGFAWYLPTFLAGVGAFVCVIIFMWHSMRTDIFRVIYDFDMSYTIDETVDSITFDKTYTFDKVSKSTYSLYHCLSNVLDTYGDIGSANKWLSYVSAYLLVVFPIMRLSCVVLVWTVPLTLQLHRIMYVFSLVQS
jgi:hypothetical protein